MTKDKTWVWLVIGLVVVLFVFGGSKINEVTSSVSDAIKNFLGGGSAPANSQGNDFMSIKMYDQNKNEVKVPGTFAIVNNVPGVSFITITTTLTNTGNSALSCDLISLTPSQFSSAITSGTKTVLVGGRAAWTSGFIDVSNFVGQSQPTIFNATGRCTYNSGGTQTTLSDKTGSLSITIFPEAGAGFDITVNSGGTPTEYCGDTVCQVSESSATCPVDCAVSSSVKFRTTDLAYVSGSAIGYSSSCGAELTKFGYGSSSSVSGYNCDDAGNGMASKGSQCGTAPVKVVSSIPGGFGGIYSGTTSLWKGTNAEKICVCRNEADGTGYKFAYYLTTDADATKVDSSSLSFDSLQEISC